MVKLRNATRAILISFLSFILFLIAFIVSLIFNPSLSQSRFSGDGDLLAVSYIRGVPFDLDITSRAGVIDLSMGLTAFMVYTLLLSLFLSFSRKNRFSATNANTSAIVWFSVLPTAILLLGFVCLDFFVDDHSLRDASTGSYVTPLRSVVACLKLSAAILAFAFAVKFLIRGLRRGISGRTLF